MAAPRQGLNPNTHSVGFTARLVTIRSISADGLTAVCVDRQNTETRVPMLVQRGKGPLPAAGETWLITQDLGIWTFSAFVGQSPSSFAGSGQLIIVSSSPPPHPSAGQLWMSGAAADELFQWSGSGWVPLQFGTSALADRAVTAAKIAPATITTAQIAPNAGITASQVAFAAEDIGALRVFRGPAPPGNAQVGDFWFNTQLGNMLSVWDGNTWAPILLGGAAIQPGSLTAAQLSAAAGIGPSQVSFSFRDIGGMSVSMQASAPLNPLTGDLWYDQSNDYALRQWNGSSWQPYQFGTGAIKARSITAELIAAGTITAQHLAAGVIYAGIVNGTTINAAVFTGSTFQGLNFVINNSGEFYYSGVPAAGNMVMSSARASGTDAAGNAYLAGFTTYIDNHPTFLNVTATNLFNGNYSVYSAATEAGPWTLIDDIHVGQSASLGPAHFISIGNGTGSAVVFSDQVFGGIRAADPNAFNSFETWHLMSLLNGWGVAARITPKYRLLPAPYKTTEIIGSLTAPAGLAAGSVIWNIPTPGYTVAGLQSVVARNVTTNAAVMLSVTTGSPQTLQYQSGAAAGDTIDFHGFLSQDA